MAYGGLVAGGVASAIPTGFEFGERLMGEDPASQDRRLRAALADRELGLRGRQLDEEAKYREGVLSNQQYSNETARGLAVKQGGYYDAHANQINKTLPAQIGKIKADTGLVDAETDYTRGAKTNSTNAQARVANASAADKEHEVAGAAQEDQARQDLTSYMNGDYDKMDPRNLQSIRNYVGLVTNPYADAAHRMFTQRTQEVMAGKKDVYTPEDNELLMNALQPHLSSYAGTKDALGNTITSVRGVGLEPVKGGGTLVKARIERVDSSGKQLPFEEGYLTEGMVPHQQGGQPSVFTPQQMHHVVEGFGKVGRLQDDNPELIQRLHEAEMQHTGKTPAESAENHLNYNIKKEIASAQYAKSEEEAANKLMTVRNHMGTSVDSQLNTMFPMGDVDQASIDPKLRDELNRARIDLLGSIKGHFTKATLGDAKEFTAERALKELYPSKLKAFSDLYARAMQAQGGGLSAPAPQSTPPRTAGSGTQWNNTPPNP
jgi:hypothetical protein